MNQPAAAPSPADVEKALVVFREKITSEHAAYLNTCVHCGLCATSCHYYLTHDDVESIPAYKLNLVNKIFRRYLTRTGKLWPRWLGAGDLDQETVETWIDSLFGRCSLCGRCSLNCTVGINIPFVIRAARSAVAALGLVPDGLQSTVDTAIAKGNNMGIERHDWLETVDWLQDELRQEVSDPKAELPLDRPGARYLYAINPREAMFFPLSILAVGKIFHAAGESWTFSSKSFDVTNYGLYNGDDEAAGLMADRLLTAARDLGVEGLLLSECGHGYNSNRWEAPQWLNRKQRLPVRSVLGVVADYAREGRIQLDPSRNAEPVTLHDPCNLVRLGGVVEEQRYLLHRATETFVEMNPNREENFCCGGGGGQLAMTQFAERRLEAGRIKVDQIRDTGARIVATPCHNCIDQLSDLKKHHKRDYEVKSVCEIVADALVLK